MGFDKQGLLGTVTAGSNVDLFFYDAQFRRVSHQPPPVRSTTGDLVANVAYDYEGPNLCASFDATGIATKLFLCEGVDLPLRFAVDAGTSFGTPDSGPSANMSRVATALVPATSPAAPNGG